MKKLVAVIVLALGVLLASVQSIAANAYPTYGVTTTTASYLNVRTGPSTNYRVVEVIRYSTRVYPTGRESNGFVQIVRHGSKRWVSKEYLKNTTQVPPKTPTPKPSNTTPPTTSPSPTPPPVSRWSPKVGASFYIQYTGSMDWTREVEVYNVDGFDTHSNDVAKLKSRGVSPVCYINAGAWEEWRPDAGEFPDSVKGTNLDGWPGEKWLDIRNIDALKPVMEKRILMCKEKGFVAIDPDNTDGWTQYTGFNITRADQVRYQKMLSEIAHNNGMAIGLKNDVEQIGDMAPYVDFAVNEECHKYKECGVYEPFLASGKPVFNIEYGPYSDQVCKTTPVGMVTVFKDLELGRFHREC